MAAPDGVPRFGVIGTGPWARAMHVPAAASSDHVRLTAVLGRDPGRARDLAQTAGAEGFTELEEFLERVDLVGFAVPPAEQARLATAVALAGKGLLLDKPVALTSVDAHALAEVVRESGVPSVVFFTQRFMRPIASWIEGLVFSGGWRYGRVETFSSVLVDEASPYNSSAWRHERGSLWDLGPHALATLCGVLGEVASVSARRGPGDLTTLSLEHRGGAQSTIAVAIDIPPVAAGRGSFFLGAEGSSLSPAIDDWDPTALEAYRSALAVLTGEAPHGRPTGMWLEVHLVDVLEAAELAIASGCAVDVTRG